MFAFCWVVEVSWCQKLGILIQPVFFLEFSSQLRLSAYHPGRWNWSIVLIHSHVSRFQWWTFWTRSLSSMFLFWCNSSSVRFSHKYKLSTGLVICLFVFCGDWHNIVLFIPSLGFSLAESCQKFGQRSRWGGPTPIANWFLAHGSSSALLSEFCCDDNTVLVSFWIFCARLEFDVCLLLSCWSVIVPEVGHFDSACFFLRILFTAQVVCLSSWTLKLEYSAYTLACLKISMVNLLNEVLVDVSLLMQFLKCKILT